MSDGFCHCKECEDEVGANMTEQTLQNLCVTLCNGHCPDRCGKYCTWSSTCEGNMKCVPHYSVSNQTDLSGSANAANNRNGDDGAEPEIIGPPYDHSSRFTFKCKSSPICEIDEYRVRDGWCDCGECEDERSEDATDVPVTCEELCNGNCPTKCGEYCNKLYVCNENDNTCVSNERGNGHYRHFRNHSSHSRSIITQIVSLDKTTDFTSIKKRVYVLAYARSIGIEHCKHCAVAAVQYRRSDQLLFSTTTVPITRTDDVLAHANYLHINPFVFDTNIRLVARVMKLDSKVEIPAVMMASTAIVRYSSDGKDSKSSYIVKSDSTAWSYVIITSAIAVLCCILSGVIAMVAVWQRYRRPRRPDDARHDDVDDREVTEPTRSMQHDGSYANRYNAEEHRAGAKPPSYTDSNRMEDAVVENAHSGIVPQATAPVDVTLTCTSELV